MDITILKYVDSWINGLIQENEKKFKSNIESNSYLFSSKLKYNVTYVYPEFKRLHRLNMSPNELFSELYSALSNTKNSEDLIKGLNNVYSNRLQQFEIKQFGTLPFKQNYNWELQLKNLCDSLNISTPVDKQIMDLIIKSYISYGSAEILYANVKIDIYNMNLTDITLIFPNNQTFPCLKAIICNIPYFDMMFKDIGNSDELNLVTDFNITTDLIKIVYDLNVINPNNYIEIFELMDQFLMKDYFYKMFDYDMIVLVMKRLLLHKNFGKIKILYQIFKNIANEPQSELNNDLYKLVIQNANTAIDIMLQNNFGEHIVMFDNWPKEFDNSHKLQSIITCGKYELFNISKIEPELVINFFAILNFPDNTYSNILNLSEKHGAKITFDPNNSKINKYNGPVISINNYYPTLKYTTRFSLSIKINKVIDNCITISFAREYDMSIQIGSNILVKSYESNYSFNVISILKCTGDDILQTNVKSATYMPKYLCEFHYKLFLNSPFNIGMYDMIYLVEHHSF